MDDKKVKPNIVGGGWRCCVEHCQSRSSIKDSKLKFYRFPKNKALANKWLHSLGIKQDDHSLYYFQRKRICGLHFTLQDEMKKNKVPKLFLEHPVTQKMMF
ncbi:hypothetical protein JTB14_036822 [Gonioctena quinquepunctata]|nr:hypothetical protein JTB14_036822 [Gonioctena quinquepunctata]